MPIHVPTIGVEWARAAYNHAYTRPGVWCGNTLYALCRCAWTLHEVYATRRATTGCDVRSGRDACTASRPHADMWHQPHRTAGITTAKWFGSRRRGRGYTPIGRTATPPMGAHPRRARDHTNAWPDAGCGARFAPWATATHGSVADAAGPGALQMQRMLVTPELDAASQTNHTAYRRVNCWL